MLKSIPLFLMQDTVCTYTAIANFEENKPVCFPKGNKIKAEK